MTKNKNSAKADDILLFASVVEAGSFSKVADQMDLSNSVISKRIARLEESLNVQLLYRSTRKLSMTDAGAALYEKSLLAKIAVQEAEEAVTGYGDEVQGHIKVTFPMVSARLALCEAVSLFCKDYPDIRVEINVENRIVDIIEEGYDLAIRTAFLEDSSLIARRLIDSQWLICASAEYLSQTPPLNDPQDLADHNCLIYKYEGAGQDFWMFKSNNEDVHVQVRGSLNCSDLEGLRLGALSGLGIAYLPRILVHEDILAGRLVTLLDHYVGKRLGIYAVYPRARLPDKRVKILIDYLRKAYEDRRDYMY